MKSLVITAKPCKDIATRGRGPDIFEKLDQICACLGFAPVYLCHVSIYCMNVCYFSSKFRIIHNKYIALCMYFKISQ